jgi:hypothetical protein
MKNTVLTSLAVLAVAGCGSGSSKPDSPATPDAVATLAGRGPADANDKRRNLTDEQKSNYDVEGVRLGDSYATIKAIWSKAHPNYQVEKKTGYNSELGGTYVTMLRLSTGSASEVLEAAFSSPASGNRAIYLKHILQESDSTPIDRKAVEAVIASKFGDTAFQDAPNIYGGEIVGRDGQLVDGCANFRFPDKADWENPGANHAQCGLTALATIDSDNASTVGSVELQVTDFALLAKLEQTEHDVRLKALEDSAKARLSGAVKPATL